MKAAIAVLVLAFGLATTAFAEDKDRARDLYQRGIQHYNLSEFPEALIAFKGAYRNFPDPVFLFNIGQCQRQIGYREDAIRSFKAFLREQSEAPNAEEVKRLIATMEAELKQEQASKASPPQGTLQPGTTAVSPVKPTVSEQDSSRKIEPGPSKKPPESAPTAAAPTETRTPLVKRWWLWTAVGAVVVAGVAIGLGVGLAQSPSYPAAMPTDGRFQF